MRCAVMRGTSVLLACLQDLKAWSLSAAGTHDLQLLPDDAGHDHSHRMALSLSLEHLVLLISREVSPDRLYHALNHLTALKLLEV